MKFTKFIALIAAAATLFAGCEPAEPQGPVSAEAVLRVVKNVMENAAEIKAENELTI